MKRLATVVGLLVLYLGYCLHGPVLTNPIVVHTDLILSEPIGAAGLYNHAFPDVVFVIHDASEVTLNHELTHHAHPSWSECQVSNYVWDTYGQEDVYRWRGDCS